MSLAACQTWDMGGGPGARYMNGVQQQAVDVAYTRHQACGIDVSHRQQNHTFHQQNFLLQQQESVVRDLSALSMYMQSHHRDSVPSSPAASPRSLVLLSPTSTLGGGHSPVKSPRSFSFEMCRLPSSQLSSPSVHSDGPSLSPRCPVRPMTDRHTGCLSDALLKAGTGSVCNDQILKHTQYARSQQQRPPSSWNMKSCSSVTERGRVGASDCHSSGHTCAASQPQGRLTDAMPESDSLSLSVSDTLEDSSGTSAEMGFGGCDMEADSPCTPLPGAGRCDSLSSQKKGLSAFFRGKSKSFTSLSDVGCFQTIQDLAKPDNPYGKRRKASKMFPLRGVECAISKKSSHHHKTGSSLAVAIAMCMGEGGGKMETLLEDADEDGRKDCSSMGEVDDPEERLHDSKLGSSYPSRGLWSKSHVGWRRGSLGAHHRSDRVCPPRSVSMLDLVLTSEGLLCSSPPTPGCPHHIPMQ